jgi:HEAT repeat protein
MYVWSPLPRSLTAALRDVDSPKSRVRVSAVHDLARWADTEERERCVSRLIRVLRDDDDVEVRAAAALALADAHAVEGLDALLDAIDHGQPRLRQMALVAVGELAVPGDGAAVQRVREALGSDAPALRFQALVAAGRLLDASDLWPCLMDAFYDAEAKVRYVACRIAEERFFDASRAPEAALVALGRGIAGLLSDPDRDVALVAAILLGRRGSKRARDLVVSALNRNRPFSQLEDEQAAIEMCADLSLDAARPGLRVRASGGVLRGVSPLAFQARVALARLGDERAREEIIRGLSSVRRSVRSQNVAAAGQARLQAARPRLLQMLDDERQADRQLVAEALEALDR